MPTTQRMNWIFPARNQRQYFDIISRFFDLIDVTSYTTTEDRNWLIMGGGDWNFTYSTGVITWNSDLIFMNFVTGYKITVLAGTITLTPGQIAYIEMPRSLTANQTVTMQVGNIVGKSDSRIVMMFRLLALPNSNRVFFRGQFVLTSGISARFYEQAPSGGGVTDHEALTGLLGGAGSDHWHLTQIEHDDLTVVGMDVSSLADQEFRGDVRKNVTVGTNALGIFAAMYLASDGTYKTGMADVAGNLPAPCCVLALQAGTGASLKVLRRGVVKNSGWTFATIGAPVYLDITTAGAVTQVKPSASGNQIQILGKAEGVNTLDFDPNPAIAQV